MRKGTAYTTAVVAKCADPTKLSCDGPCSRSKISCLVSGSLATAEASLELRSSVEESVLWKRRPFVWRQFGSRRNQLRTFTAEACWRMGRFWE